LVAASADRVTSVALALEPRKRCVRCSDSRPLAAFKNGAASCIPCTVVATALNNNDAKVRERAAKLVHRVCEGCSASKPLVDFGRRAPRTTAKGKPQSRGRVSVCRECVKGGKGYLITA